MAFSQWKMVTKSIYIHSIYIVNVRDFALSYGYPMVIVWLSYGKPIILDRCGAVAGGGEVVSCGIYTNNQTIFSPALDTAF